MGDLIRREALFDAMREKEWQNWPPLDEIDAVIEKAPAVDAVEVVRCKDCKHCAVDKYVERTFCVLNGEVKQNGRVWFGVGVSEDHYCSHGVRKEKKDAVD